MNARPVTSLLRPLGLGAAALALWACIGGTGTDTENGVVNDNHSQDLSVAAHVTDSDGYGLAGVVLTLRKPAFRPDSGAASANVLDSAHELRTDSAGNVKFSVAHAGKYVVEGARNGAIIFFDTLAVADSIGVTAYSVRSQPPRNFQGTIRLASGLRVDSGVIFVRGTGLSAPVVAGAFALGRLPSEVSLMSVGVRYRASAQGFRVAEQKTPVPDTGHHVNLSGSFTCREITADSAKHLPAVSTTLDTARAGAQPNYTAGDPGKLDSLRVRAAANSCDSLDMGTIVMVQPKYSVVPQVNLENLSVPYVVVANDASLSLIPKLVSVRECVAVLGSEVTTFSVQMLSTPAGSDALVTDINPSCK